MAKDKEIMENILRENSGEPELYLRVLLKEYVQILALDFIYSHSEYKSLVFYGGTCLAHCFGLPRLSEDLDFVDTDKSVDLDIFANDLEKFFKKKINLPVSVRKQKFRVELKFPILHELGLGNTSDTNLLILKVEVFSDFNFCKNYKTEIKPLFKFNKSILVKTFDLPTLMSTKIRAVLNRKWEKTNKSGETIISVKGRDYFDLMWYLQKGVKPNMDCLEVDDISTLKVELLEMVKKLDTNSVVLDLENFIADKEFVRNLGKNIKDILKVNIEGL